MTNEDLWPQSMSRNSSCCSPEVRLRITLLVAQVQTDAASSLLQSAALHADIFKIFFKHLTVQTSCIAPGQRNMLFVLWHSKQNKMTLPVSILDQRKKTVLTLLPFIIKQLNIHIPKHPSALVPFGFAAGERADHLSALLATSNPSSSVWQAAPGPTGCLQKPTD